MIRLLGLLFIFNAPCFSLMSLMAQTAETRSVYDTAPQFPGGQAALMEFIQREVALPRIPDSIPLPQKMYFEFIVDTSGQIDSLKIKRSSGYKPLDQAYYDVLLKMPNWKPAMYLGKKVSVKIQIPIQLCFE